MPPVVKDAVLAPMPPGSAPPAEPPLHVKRWAARQLVDRALDSHRAPDRPEWWTLLEWLAAGMIVEQDGEPRRVRWGAGIRDVYPLIEQLAEAQK